MTRSSPRRVESLGGVSIGVPPATTSSVPVAHEPVVWEDVAGEGVSDTDGAEELRSHERGVHEDVAGRDVAQEDVAQEHVAQEEVAQEGVAQEDVGHGPVAQEEAAQEDVVYEEAALQELAEEDADQEDLSQEDLILDDDPWVAGDAGAWGADTDSGLASVDLTTWGDDESASTESEAAYGDDPDADAMSASEEADLYTRTMGELYARQGLYDQAVTVYEHLLEADPENPSFRERLAELHDLAADAPPPSVDSDAVTADDGAHTATDILADDLAASPEGLDVPTPFAWSETDEEERLPGEADRATSDYCDELLALDEEDATATADDVDAIWDIPEDGLARGDDVVMSAANPASGIEEPAIESVGPGQISDLAVVPFGFTDAEGEPASEAAAAFSEAVVDSLAPDDVIPVSVESLAPEGVTPVSVESLDRDADPSVSTESLDVAGVTAVSIESLAPDSATVISVASLAPFADAAVAIESLAPDSSTVVPIELLGPVGEVETAADSAPPAEPEVADAFAEWLNQLKP